MHNIILLNLLCQHISEFYKITHLKQQVYICQNDIGYINNFEVRLKITFCDKHSLFYICKYIHFFDILKPISSAVQKKNNV